MCGGGGGNQLFKNAPQISNISLCCQVCYSLLLMVSYGISQLYFNRLKEGSVSSI